MLDLAWGIVLRSRPRGAASRPQYEWAKGNANEPEAMSALPSKSGHWVIEDDIGYLPGIVIGNFCGDSRVANSWKSKRTGKAKHQLMLK